MQPLALRVLRLQRPAPFGNRQSPSSPAESALTSETLLLPTSFGTIHLGEEFHALLVATNDSDERVDSAGLRGFIWHCGPTGRGLVFCVLFLLHVNISAGIEMQTSSQKSTLADLRSDTLEPGQAIQARVHFDVKEPGPRTLSHDISVASL